MPRGLRKKTKQYVLDRFQEEDPEGFFKYKSKSAHGMTQDQQEFIQAVEGQSVQKIRSMLNRGVDPNFLLLRKKQTPLHIVVENQYGSDDACEKILGVMLFFGADPNAQDNDGYSPLHTACIAGNALAVELLLQAGGDANLVNNIGETPLMSTCRYLSDKSSHIVDLLLTSGAEVLCTNNESQSVLHMFTVGHFLYTARVLLPADRHVIVETLLKHGNCTNIVDCYGLSPLCYELLLLLRLPPAISHATQNAEVLIRGGAVLQAPKDFEELESCVTKASSTIREPVASYIVPLLIKCHLAMPSSQLQFLIDLVKKVFCRFGTPAADSLDRLMSATQGIVPSLTQLSRLNIKQCLGGYAFSSVVYLPLPDKMKDYICSND